MALTKCIINAGILFENVLPSPQGAITRKSREPFVNIMEEYDGIKIIAELPWIRIADINLETSERTLLITV
ncbi:MAG: hypothetical protein ACE5I5_05965 [Candidatus Heimdallarchaeota archaeon]